MPKEKFRNFLPGMRMLKTTFAIFICIVIDVLRNSPNLVTSGITAILVMQINMDSSYSRGKIRLLGIFISGIYSILFYYLFVGILNVQTLSLVYVSYDSLDDNLQSFEIIRYDTTWSNLFYAYLFFTVRN